MAFDGQPNVHRFVRAAMNPKEEGGPREVRLPVWMAFDPRITNAERRFLMFVGWRARNGVARFSLRELARALGQADHKALARAARSAQQKGAVYIEEGTRTDGSRGTSTYVLIETPPEGFELPFLLDEDDEDEAPVEPIPGEGAPRDNGAERGREVPGPGTPESPHKKNGPSTERGKLQTNENPAPSRSLGNGKEAPDGAARPAGEAPGGASERPRSPEPSPPVAPAIETGPPPSPVFRVGSALRAWAAAKAPSVNIDDALRGFLAFHEARGGVPDPKAADALFRGWVLKRAKIHAHEARGKPGRARPVDPALVAATDLGRWREELRGQIEDGSPRQKNVLAAMVQLHRAVGPDAWRAWFGASRWTLNGVVLEVRAGDARRAARLAERYGEAAQAAVRQSFGRGRRVVFLE